MSQVELVEFQAKRIRDSLGDLSDMAHVDELWDEDLAALKAIADTIEGLVTGSADAAVIRHVLTS